MKFSEVVQKRQSTRAFLDQEVPRELLTQLLQLASLSPSGANMQPWNVAVVAGEKKQQLAQALEAAFKNRADNSMDYQYYPSHWQEPFKSRRRACGLQLYQSQRIGRHDKEKREQQWVANYHGFGAPVILFFFVDQNLAEGSLLDLGMFMQTLMLAATEAGLATCAQGALAQYPDIIRQQLSIVHSKKLIAGMALGYADNDATVNQYRTPRESVEQFCSFYDKL